MLQRWGVAILLLLALSIVASRLKPARPVGTGPWADDWAAFDKKTFDHPRVIDGDTIAIRNGHSDEVRVRLLGIDAPEMHAGTGEPPDYWAVNATDALRRLAARSVTLQLEPTQTRDRYGRLLAYIYADDTDNINLDLIRQGHVYADRRFPHTQRRPFEQAEAQARERKLGLWKNVQESQMPAWRQRFVGERDNRSTNSAR